MAHLRRFNQRHQITVPPSVLRDAGLPEGGLYSIEAKDGRIILEPKEVEDKDLEEKDWAALEALVRKQVEAKSFTQYSTPQDAKRHFRRLGK